MAQKSAAAVKSAKSGKASAPCTPIAIDVAVLTPDQKTKILLGLSRCCKPKIVWTIHFVLQEIDGDILKDRVKVDVTLGDDKMPKAEAVAARQKGKPATDPQLEAAKLDLLQTRIADRAAELPPGTTSDPVIESMLPRVL
jgi:hypothetical protein